MEHRDKVVALRGLSIKTLLPTIFSAISVLTTAWISYQNSQLTPKVNEISDRVTQLQTQAEQTSGGVAGLQQVDEARKLELFRRLSATKADPQEVQQAFREVFPEDQFWANESLTRSANTTTGAAKP